MTIEIKLKKGEELRKLELVSEISKRILTTDFFKKETVIDGFLYIDKYVVKDDFTINVEFKHKL